MSTEVLNRPTPGELEVAAGRSAHGVAAITVNLDGDVVVICVCDQAGTGVDEAAARKQLEGHDQ